MKTQFKAITVGTLTTLATCAALAGSPQQISAQEHDAAHSKESVTFEMAKDLKEAWTQGKLEGLYMINDHLSAYNIDTQIDGHTVTLSGSVDSEAKKELAEEIASNLEGINAVNNDLSIDKAAKSAESENDTNRDLKTVISDASTTASIKLKFIESEVKARNINIDTLSGVVTLTGEVGNDTIKDLALEIASNTDGVKSVENQLEVVELKSKS